MARKTKQQATETRNQIIDAAVSCFSEFGVSATSLADIACAAGVTRGAIYWHFKNKTDLLNELLTQSDSLLENQAQAYRLKHPSDPVAVLRDMLVYVLKTTAEDQRRRQVSEIMFHKCEFVGEMKTLHVMQRSFYLECYDKIEITLKQCIAAGQFSEGLTIRRAAVIIRAYITGLIENWLFMPDSFDLAGEASLLVATLIEMLQYSPTLTQPSLSSS
mgnify:CR=1 FL=1